MLRVGVLTCSHCSEVTDQFNCILVSDCLLIKILGQALTELAWCPSGLCDGFSPTHR